MLKTSNIILKNRLKSYGFTRSNVLTDIITRNNANKVREEFLSDVFTLNSYFRNDSIKAISALKKEVDDLQMKMHEIPFYTCEFTLYSSYKAVLRQYSKNVKIICDNKILQINISAKAIIPKNSNTIVFTLPNYESKSCFPLSYFTTLKDFKNAISNYNNVMLLEFAVHKYNTNIQFLKDNNIFASITANLKEDYFNSVFTNTEISTDLFTEFGSLKLYDERSIHDAYISESEYKYAKIEKNSSTNEYYANIPGFAFLLYSDFDPVNKEIFLSDLNLFVTLLLNKS